MMPLRRMIENIQEDIEKLSPEEIQNLSNDCQGLKVSTKDVENALERTGKSVSLEEIQKHTAWKEKFGSRV